MKIIFISAVLFIYGWFCDICIKICEKLTENKLKKGRELNGKFISLISNFTNNRLTKWETLEKKVIHHFAEQSF